MALLPQPVEQLSGKVVKRGTDTYPARHRHW